MRPHAELAQLLLGDDPSAIIAALKTAIMRLRCV
jgi:hypothetical protein